MRRHGGSGRQGGEGLGVGRTGDAAFGEDGGDVARGSDVEGRMGGGNVGGDAHAVEMSDFGSGALFDGNVVAVGDGKIERGDRRGDVEGHVVFFGEHGDLVGADFVGGVAVGGDAVCAGDDGANFAGFEEVADHVVGDECERDAALVKLPGGEARALKIGAGFGDEDVEFFALVDGDANDAESGANAAGGESAGVALGHDVPVARHEFGAEAGDGFIGGALFEMDLLGFGDEGLADFGEVESLRWAWWQGGGEFGEAALHAFESPEKIDGGGASFGERVADLGEVGAQGFDGVCGRVEDAESDAHGGGDSDGGSAANDHFADGFGDFEIAGVGVGDFFGGEQALVKNDHAAVGPLDGLSYIH